MSHANDFLELVQRIRGGDNEAAALLYEPLIRRQVRLQPDREAARPGGHGFGIPGARHTASASGGPPGAALPRRKLTGADRTLLSRGAHRGHVSSPAKPGDNLVKVEDKPKDKKEGGKKEEPKKVEPTQDSDKHQRLLKGNAGVVLAVAFHPDGKRSPRPAVTWPSCSGMCSSGVSPKRA